MDSRPPKLLDRVRQAIRVRHYSRRTEEAYVHWIGMRLPNIGLQPTAAGATMSCRG